jgi:hypothetical protein
VVGGVAVVEARIEVERRFAVDVVSMAVHLVGRGAGVADVDGADSGIVANAADDRGGVSRGEAQLANGGGAGPMQERIRVGEAGGKFEHREVLVQLVGQTLGIPIHNRVTVVEDQGQVGNRIQANR